MPDQVFPPLAEFPSSSMSPEFLGQVAHAAQWANTFGGQDTNLVQRWRHNQDINAYAQALEEQRAAAQADLIQRDQSAQNFYFRAKRLDMQHEEAQSRMAHETALLPLTMEVKRAQAAAAREAERMSALRDGLLAEDRVRRDRDGVGFSAQDSWA